MGTYINLTGVTFCTQYVPLPLPPTPSLHSSPPHLTIHCPPPINPSSHWPAWWLHSRSPADGMHACTCPTPLANRHQGICHPEGICISQDGKLRSYDQFVLTRYDYWYCLFCLKWAGKLQLQACNTCYYWMLSTEHCLSWAALSKLGRQDVLTELWQSEECQHKYCGNANIDSKYSTKSYLPLVIALMWVATI